ncbi:hypothetical protein OIU76_029764 [Salix suchowensis]|nr:hypothetical protein OIU76_029764 [Salix suchowensis]
MANVLSPGIPRWPRHNSTFHSMPPMPWIGEFGDRPPDFGPGGFNGAPPGHGRELSAEFSMKILCSTGKIGKGSSNFKAVVQEAGASIHVEDASAKSEEHAIRILGQGGQDINEMRRSQADIRVYPKNEKPKCATEDDELVQDINEMRRLQADIRVYPKNEKPKCASEDDELVQISGNYGVATDVLDIASRLGARTLND